MVALLARPGWPPGRQHCPTGRSRRGRAPCGLPVGSLWTAKGSPDGAHGRVRAAPGTGDGAPAGQGGCRRSRRRGGRVSNRVELDHVGINTMIDWRALATRQRGRANPPTTPPDRRGERPADRPADDPPAKAAGHPPNHPAEGPRQIAADLRVQRVAGGWPGGGRWRVRWAGSAGLNLAGRRGALAGQIGGLPNGRGDPGPALQRTLLAVQFVRVVRVVRVHETRVFWIASDSLMIGIGDLGVTVLNPIVTQ